MNGRLDKDHDADTEEDNVESQSRSSAGPVYSSDLQKDLVFNAVI